MGRGKRIHFDTVVIPCLSVSLQVEAAGRQHRLDGDIQRGVRCFISAGAVRGLQKKCGAPLLTFGGIRKPGSRAPHSETYGHAHRHQALFGRREEALHPLLRSRVRL